MVESRRFGWAALASAGAFLFAYVALILTPVGQDLENLALMGARLEFEDIRQSSLSELQGISTASFVVAIGLIMLVAVLRRKPVLAITVALVMGISVGLAEIAKALLVRPELVEAPPRWLNNSFPSGHVTIAVAIGIGAVLVVPYVLRPITTLVAASYAMGIGQAVEVAGWHRLSGLIGATFLVLAVASLALYLLARSGRVERFVRPPRLGAVIVTVLLGGFGAVVGLAGLFFGVARSLPIPDTPSDGDMTLAYTSTFLIGSAVIALAFVGFLWLIRAYRIDERAAG